jgi:hypothetical protein
MSNLIGYILGRYGYRNLVVGVSVKKVYEFPVKVVNSVLLSY